MSSLRRYDLLAVLVLCCLQIILVLFGVTGPLRIAGGFLFVALLPGYSLLAATYPPRSRGLTALEHVVLAIPVSLALDVALGLLLNNLGWSVRPERQVLWLGTVTAVLAVAALLHSASREASPVSAREAALLGTIPCLALALGLLPSLIAQPARADVVSLSLLGINGKSEAYPVAVQRETPFQVRISVDFQGTSRRTFELASPTGASRRIVLRPEHTWTAMVEVRAHAAGRQKLSWTLSSVGSPRLQRSVHLWLQVS
jgi:uncharacterized membrane protein